MIELFDTHTHLTDDSLSSQLESVIDRALQVGVQEILCVGTTAASSRKAISIANGYRRSTPRSASTPITRMKPPTTIAVD